MKLLFEPGGQRLLALLWLAVVLVAGLYLGARIYRGLDLRSDLVALLPRDEVDAGMREASDAVAAALSRRLVIMVGHRDREQARNAASAMREALAHTGQVELIELGARDQRSIGALYLRYREGLLAEADRKALTEGNADAIEQRALSQVFGPLAMVDGELIRRDPFLLLPAYFVALPNPLGAVAVEEGMPTVVADGATWVLLGGRLRQSPYDLEVQRSVVDAVEQTALSLGATHEGMQVLRLGAVFFARRGAQTAMQEVENIGTAAVAGSVLLVLLVFRSLVPLLLTQLSIAIGMLTGFATALAVFGDLHVMSMLLGMSLIGVVADYSFYYCSEIFAPDAGDARQRLARVLPGISVGLAAAMTGYAILLLAPLPGLHQLAAFALAGLAGAFLTTVLWMPVLDRMRPRSGGRLLVAAQAGWRFWDGSSVRPVRLLAASLLAAAAVAGALRFTIDDDVRRLQTLAPDLLAEQARIQALVGTTVATQFFVVRAVDDETALQHEEALFERLAVLRREGALGAYRGPASFVPSAARQVANRVLVRDRLGGERLARHLAVLGLDSPAEGSSDDGPLTLREAQANPGLAPVLAELRSAVASGVVHVVMLDDVGRAGALRDAAAGLDGVSFVDPAADFSALLGRYRERAMLLVLISAVTVTFLVGLRFGPLGALRVMAPALVAAVLAPLLRALLGAPFTFFDAMALVLVLGINVDYAVFCADSSQSHRPVTLLAVWMTMVSTLMSFGLLALSSAAAVQAFGTTTALGVALAAVLAPLAAKPAAT